MTVVGNQGGAESSESGDNGGLSAVEAAAFNDSTPVEDYVPGQEGADDDTDTGEDDDSFEEDDDTSEGGSAEHEEDDDVDVDDDDIKPASFDDLEAANKHIAKLNRENAKRRTESKAYESVFGKFDDESKGRLLEIVDELAVDPESGARTLLQVAKNILGEDALKEQEVDEDKPLTLKEWKELQKKEETRKAETRRQEQEREENEKAVKAIFTKADELGYKEGSVERHTLLAIAAASEKNGGTNGNLDKAHEAFEKMVQARIDSYINGKGEQADSFPITGEGAQPANKGKSPTTWDDFVRQGTEMGNAHLNVGK